MNEWVFKGIVPLLAALLGVAIQAQIQASWGPWLKVATITAVVVIIGYALVSVVRPGWPAMRRRLRGWRIERDVRHDVVGVASRVAEATNRNFTLSVGSVLNTLFDAKVCDAVTVNAWGSHLGTLQSTLRDILGDLTSTRSSVPTGATRLCEFHRDYIRLCGSIADAVQRCDRPDLRRSWGGIADHANTLSAQLVQITHRIQAQRGDDLQCYFDPVPKI